MGGFMRRYKILMLLAALPILVTAAWAQVPPSLAPPALRLLRTIPINGTAASPTTKMYSFDISWWDPTTNLYLLADRSNAALDVIDTRTDTLFGQIGANPGFQPGFAGETGNADTSGPNGVTVAPNLPCIFATDTAKTGGGRVVSFNYNVSFTTTASSVNTGGIRRAGELAFDPRDNVILAINNADTPPFGTLISVSPACQLSVVKQILFTAANRVNATGGAEQPVWQGPSAAFPQGKFFVSIPQFDNVASRGGVLQLSASGAVDGIYQVNFCGPAGLTVGPNGDLLVGCSLVFDTSGNACSAAVPHGAPATCTGIANPQMAICNPGRGCADGSLVAVPGVGGGGEVWFNPGDGNYYVTAQNDPVGPVVGVIVSEVNQELMSRIQQTQSALSKLPPGHGEALELVILESLLVSIDTLVQLVPTLPPVPAVPGVRSGSTHSIAASFDHLYVALPANTSYPNCVQGCIAVYTSVF
jgi:hypothetical protein